MDKYLVVQGARFGDLLQTKRLILSLARQGQVYVLADQTLCDFAGLAYPEARILPANFHDAPKNGLPASPGTLEELSNTNFTAIYNCNFSPLTASICRLFDENKVIGYRAAICASGGVLRSQWCRLAFRLAAQRTLTSLNLVDFWGWFSAAPVATVNPAAKGRGNALGVVVSGREERRSLPPEMTARIISVVFGLGGCKKIKFFGTAADAEKTKRIIRHLPGKLIEKVENLTGKTTLVQLYEEIGSLERLISPDTGIMHLGAHLGIPVIAFFLASANCHETAPYGRGHVIFQANPACAPCLEKQPCSHDLICRAPFSSDMFPRILAGILENRQPAAIPSLQCWQTELDNLGQNLRLALGDDPFQKERRALRNLLKFKVGLEEDDVSSGDIPQEQKLQKRFLPASEWMLPPWRYA